MTSNHDTPRRDEPPVPLLCATAKSLVRRADCSFRWAAALSRLGLGRVSARYSTRGAALATAAQMIYEMADAADVADIYDALSEIRDRCDTLLEPARP